MAIEHVDATDPEIHEPKGVAAATSSQVYLANGAGSGSWTDNIHNTHAEMYITSNTTAMALTAATDSTLATDSDYTKITVGWVLNHSDGITFSTDKLVVPIDGDYEVSFWASLQIASNNNTIAVKYSINDSTPYSTRKVLQRSDAANDITNISSSGLIDTLSAGDTISVYVAADVTGNVTIKEAGLTAKLIHPA